MAKVTKNLKWRNKLSGEEGFVMTVSAKNNCFYNTYDQSKAKKYSSNKTIENDLRLLAGMGEMQNNDFVVV